MSNNTQKTVFFDSNEHNMMKNDTLGTEDSHQKDLSRSMSPTFSKKRNLSEMEEGEQNTTKLENNTREFTKQKIGVESDDLDTGSVEKSFLRHVIKQRSGNFPDLKRKYDSSYKNESVIFDIISSNENTNRNKKLLQGSEWVSRSKMNTMLYENRVYYNGVEHKLLSRKKSKFNADGVVKKNEDKDANDEFDINELCHAEDVLQPISSLKDVVTHPNIKRTFLNDKIFNFMELQTALMIEKAKLESNVLNKYVSVFLGDDPLPYLEEKMKLPDYDHHIDFENDDDSGKIYLDINDLLRENVRDASVNSVRSKVSSSDELAVSETDLKSDGAVSDSLLGRESAAKQHNKESEDAEFQSTVSVERNGSHPQAVPDSAESENKVKNNASENSGANASEKAGNENSENANENNAHASNENANENNAHASNENANENNAHASNENAVVDAREQASNENAIENASDVNAAVDANEKASGATVTDNAAVAANENSGDVNEHNAEVAVTDNAVVDANKQVTDAAENAVVDATVNTAGANENTTDANENTAEQSRDEKASGADETSEYAAASLPASSNTQPATTDAPKKASPASEIGTENLKIQTSEPESAPEEDPFFALPTYEKSTLQQRLSHLTGYDTVTSQQIDFSRQLTQILLQRNQEFIKNMVAIRMHLFKIERIRERIVKWGYEFSGIPEEDVEIPNVLTAVKRGLISASTNRSSVSGALAADQQSGGEEDEEE